MGKPRVIIEITLEKTIILFLIERNWYGFFWFENGYRLCPFWSEIGYSF